MLERALAWIQHWLPFIQGFAALASIGGALLSWRYALKAQRAREEMTRNVITSKLVTTLDFVVAQLRDLRVSAVAPDGRPDWAAYRAREQESKKILEEALAQARASTTYFRKPPEQWSEMISKLIDASANPDASAIESACKVMMIVSAELKLAAATRELASSP
jgi:hypothetical protein